MLIRKDSHEPQFINDLIFGNPESQLRIQDLISGAEALPSSGKSGILLYGVPGTGKTTLAKLLPDAIEKEQFDSELVYPEELIPCQQGFSGPQVMNRIEGIMSRSSLNASGLHYFVIDEVDNLTKLAQQSMKSAMNTSRAIFILTTNNVSMLDKGMLDRCILVEMNAATPETYLPIARKIAADSNVVLNDSDLLPTINAANGSLRNLMHNVGRLVRRNSLVQPNVIY